MKVALKMTGTWPTTIKSTSVSRLVLILPVQGQKVKGIGPSPLEVLLRRREKEPTRTADRTVIAARFRHDVNASLQELQTRLMIPDVDQLILPLVAYRHRHNIQPGGHYLTITISAIPTNGLFT